MYCARDVALPLISRLDYLFSHVSLMGVAMGTVPHSGQRPGVARRS